MKEFRETLRDHFIHTRFSQCFLRFYVYYQYPDSLYVIWLCFNWLAGLVVWEPEWIWNKVTIYIDLCSGREMYSFEHISGWQYVLWWHRYKFLSVGSKVQRLDQPWNLVACYRSLFCKTDLQFWTGISFFMRWSHTHMRLVMFFDCIDHVWDSLFRH